MTNFYNSCRAMSLFHVTSNHLYKSPIAIAILYAISLTPLPTQAASVIDNYNVLEDEYTYVRVSGNFAGGTTSTEELNETVATHFSDNLSSVDYVSPGWVCCGQAQPD
ncbi:MAG: hypothetical protein KDI88_12430, partial [Gammaproteobacteria bacterium]|nr:hypothetical protein [Gammaproteobacteria bacterium]